METEPYRIPIDGDWTLEDLYVFPRTWGQVYAFLYSMVLLSELEEDLDENDRLYLTYTSQPWRGGYSTVNFYNYLQKIVPQPYRPRIISMQFSSPGWFELGVLALAATQINKIVKSFCDSGREINSLYNEIYKGLRERELQGISVKREELKLAEEYADFLDISNQEISKRMGFKYLNELNQITDNRLASLKMTLSFYRRIRTLVKFQSEGKARFFD